MPVARPLQPCPACAPVLCCSDNPFSYSLVNGPVYENDQVAINFECPPGFTCIPGTYVIPAGRIRFIPNGDTLRLQCCQSEIVRPVPPGATAAEIGVIAKAMANACALQAAQCAGEATMNRSQGINFRNIPQCANNCPPPQLLGYTTPPLLDSNVTLVEGRLCVGGSQFIGNTQAIANARALQYLLNRIATYLGDGRLLCGYWNEEQICAGDPPEIIEAFTFFSVVSQEEANELALDSCLICGSNALCRIIGYTPTMFDNPGTTGTVIGPLQITNVIDFVTSSQILGHPTPDTLLQALALQGAFGISSQGKAVGLDAVIGGGPAPGNFIWGLDNSYTGCTTGPITELIGQTITFYATGATSVAETGLFQWDGEFYMDPVTGVCGGTEFVNCREIAGQVFVRMLISLGPPYTMTVFSGYGLLIWEGQSATEILGPYVRSGGSSANPADLSIEVIS